MSIESPNPRSTPSNWLYAFLITAALFVVVYLDRRERIAEITKLREQVGATKAGPGVAMTKTSTPPISPRPVYVSEVPALSETEAASGPAAESGKKETLATLREIQAKTSIEFNFGPLFKRLDLNGFDREQFSRLLYEKSSVAIDVRRSATEAGINTVDPFQRARLDSLVVSGRSDVDEKIKGLLGEPAYENFKYYEATLPQRGTADILTERLKYSSRPLDESQIERLITATSQHPVTTTSSTGGTLNVVLAYNRGPSGVRLISPISEESISTAKAFLQPEQLNALIALRDEQTLQWSLGAVRKQSPKK